jgi:hypothetical protein
MLLFPSSVSTAEALFVEIIVFQKAITVLRRGKLKRLEMNLQLLLTNGPLSQNTSTRYHIDQKPLEYFGLA